MSFARSANCEADGRIVVVPAQPILRTARLVRDAESCSCARSCLADAVMESGAKLEAIRPNTGERFVYGTPASGMA